MGEVDVLQPVQQLASLGSDNAASDENGWSCATGGCSAQGLAKQRRRMEPHLCGVENDFRMLQQW